MYSCTSNTQFIITLWGISKQDMKWKSKNQNVERVQAGYSLLLATIPRWVPMLMVLKLCWTSDTFGLQVLTYSRTLIIYFLFSKYQIPPARVHCMILSNKYLMGRFKFPTSSFLRQQRCGAHWHQCTFSAVKTQQCVSTIFYSVSLAI